MKLIGITGGIGSGKSLICRIFAIMGIPMYEADTRAKWLITNDIILKKSIIQLLSSTAYLPDGSYNRTWVASQVFGNPNLLQQLNQLVHPRVREDAAQWITQHQSSPFLLYEAALMQASGNGNTFDINMNKLSVGTYYLHVAGAGLEKNIKLEKL